MVLDVLPPGPRLPVAVQTAAWIFRPWDFMERCAARYGDTFTLRLAGERPWVMVSHPDVVKEVFTGPRELLHAGQANRILRPFVGANSVLLLDGDAHMEQRRLLMPPFRGSHLTSYTDTMTAVAQSAIAGWPRGEPIRLHPLMQSLTLEIILRVVFGLNEGARLDHLRAELVRTLAASAGVAGQMLLVLGPRKVRAALIRKLFRNVDRLLYAEIDERRRCGDLEERSDVLSVLLRTRHEDGRPMSNVEIRDELMTLLLAGHDTTATALAWMVERLVRHPDDQARLVEEIRAGDHQFRDAVIKETLRLRPVLSLVARRLKAPLEIGGVELPAGVNVVPSIYLTHRRPDLYPNPEQFRPQRFLEHNPGANTWIPFGGGVRRCLGAAFAEHEMRIVLGTLFGSCTVAPISQRAEPMKRRGITHVPRRGATVTLH
ncbi:cytochrome P450 [Mycolicibacterium komossense]|uniref:Cytochrome P450 n=1 Tax=Mycolicibacterium komossense TaxID=1779 RepID=A0ABT3CLP7_9MYCO|nr:cytochrome P450 [Mycolicibacterium komossense]MCV7230409.1 cytochrome P450 [Mycolicibacterium komossense]